jgi:hypothetical protein
MLWLGLILFLALIVALAVAGFFYMQIKKGKSPEEKLTGIKDVSSIGECARCKQHRIIVKREAGLCAACWSSINTKQIG